MSTVAAATGLDAETKSIIEDAIDRFVRDVYEPTARLHRLNRPPVDYRLHWPALAELGLLGLPVAEALGGIGGSAQDVGDALQVLARGLVLEPFIEAAVIAAAVLRAGPEAEAALADSISGEVLTVLVGGRRDDDLKCAKAANGGFGLRGTARVVPGAAQADAWLIACAEESGLLRILRIEPRHLDARVRCYRMMDGREACDVEFNPEVTVAASSLWLEGVAAEQALAAAAMQAVNAYCADAVGVMQSLMKITAEYLRTREQFGVPLASFQALQHRFSDMHMAWLDSRSITRKLARSIDAEEAGSAWLCFAAHSVVSRRGERVGHEAIQMHGGMGVTDELIVSHYNSRLVVLNQLLARWAPPAAPQAQAAN